MYVPKIEPLGDSAVLISFGEQVNEHVHQAVQRFFQTVVSNPFKWMIEAVPAFTTVAIYYDVLKLSQESSPFYKVKKDIESFLEMLDTAELSSQRESVIDIPVCYGGDHGPDLDEVAGYHGLTPHEVIRLHTEGDYLVYMIGFAPGFPYLGGLNEKLATPRRETPRMSIPAGSVGIAGGQTGVYPLESPGGWQIIGRTPLTLFDPKKNSPSLLDAGDHVRFYSISADEFDNWGGANIYDD